MSFGWRYCVTPCHVSCSLVRLARRPSRSRRRPEASSVRMISMSVSRGSMRSWPMSQPRKSNLYE